MVLLLAALLLVLHVKQLKTNIMDLSPKDLFNGDFANMEDMFIFPMDNSGKVDEVEIVKRMHTRKDDNFPFMNENKFTKEFKSHDILKSYDMNEFNDINNDLFAFTRRHDRYSTVLFIDPNDTSTHINEQKKQIMMMNINLQFLLHTRHKLADALTKRKLIQYDKRYKLGYLFNRVRRILTDQRKLISVAHKQYGNGSVFQDLTALLRMYERVVRYDVDLKDTAELIKSVYSEKHFVDDVTLPDEYDDEIPTTTPFNY